MSIPVNNSAYIRLSSFLYKYGENIIKFTKSVYLFLLLDNGKKPSMTITYNQSALTLYVEQRTLFMLKLIKHRR